MVLRYCEIKEQILKDITLLQPHDKIMSRPAICQKYLVTRTTVDRAINELIREGILYSVDGSGTYVADGDKRNTPYKQDVINIGVLLPNIMADTYPGILKGIEDVTRKLNINVVLCNTDNNYQKRYLVRPDASTFHTFYMDVETGLPKFGRTRQGYSDTSCWSRGQAWGIYGFSLSYAYTGDSRFLGAAEKVADYFLSRLPDDHICCWDLIFTDGSAPRDSSAAAIAACGLLQYLDEVPFLHPRRKIYEKAALCIVDSLIDGYLARDGKSNGLLLHSVYSIPEKMGIDECCIWGDYFFLEALVRLTRRWRRYW